MRIYGFDVLRGLCAIGVAAYHVLGWLGVGHPYNLGLYGVYVFFVLSGASLMVAYADRLEHGYPLAGFYAARFFRLAPLFWLVVVATPIIIGSEWKFSNLILNFSFLFGLANPGQTSIPTGGWSLGIEFVFYLLFPIFIIAVRKRYVGYFFGLLLYVTQMAFVSEYVKVPGDLGGNWIAYTQVMAFVFYFYAGMLIGQWLCLQAQVARPTATHGFLFVCLAGGVACTSGAVIEDSLTGFRLFLLPLACCAMVLYAARLFAVEWRVVALLARCLGNSSYGVYLLHPLIFAQLMKEHSEFASNNPFLFLVFVLAISIIFSLLIERWLERPIREYGKSLFPWTYKCVKSSSSEVVSSRY